MSNIISPDNVLTSKFPLKDVPNISVIKYLINRLNIKPLKDAIIDCPSGRVWISEQIIEMILNSASAWTDIIGLKKGDSVCFVSYNNDYYAISMFGVIAAGGIVTGTSDNSPYRVIQNIIEQTDAKYIVASENNYESAAKVKDNLPQIKEIIINTNKYNYEVNGHMLKTLKSLLNYDHRNCTVKFPLEIDNINATIGYFFTSGSCGPPKPVILTHESVLHYIIQFTNEAYLGPLQQCTFSVMGPLSHNISYLLIYQIANYAKIAIIPRFLEKEFLNYINKYEITHCVLITTILNYFINSNTSKYDLPSLIDISCDGTALAPETAKKSIKKFSNLKYFRQTYGMTEINHVTMGIRREGKQDYESLGEIIPGFKIKICNPETGAALGPNNIGEIWVKGPQVTKGYLNRPIENAEFFDSERFLRTGDSAYYDENGRIFFSDRYKEIIKYDAQVVSPTELQSILLTHPAVAEAAVIGVKDEIHGQLPKAFVVKRKGYDTITEHELIHYVNERVTFFKRLSGGLEFRDYFERTLSGKINKLILK